MLLDGEITATAWLPTCDLISTKQWSYAVSAQSDVHLLGKTTCYASFHSKFRTAHCT